MFVLVLTSALAQPPDGGAGFPDEDLDVIDVRAPRPVHPPCRTVLSGTPLRAFPAREPAELAGAVNGLHLARHLGRSGVWDWSWRGFDAGHGRDLEVTLWGIPLNEPGHFLGAGTVDLSFLPHHLVEALDLCPGGSEPTAGPFATAGTLRLILAGERTGWWGRLGAGTDSSGELSVTWAPRRAPPGTFLSVEGEEGQGVGADQGWRHLRLAGAVEGDLGPLRASAFLALHDGAFDVPPELRLDDLLAGNVAFREGYRFWSSRGSSRRLLLGARLVRPWTWGGLSITAWFGAKGFRLVDNRTGLLVDPVNGDGEERRQSSIDSGLRATFLHRFALRNDEAQVHASLEVRGASARQRVDDVDLLGQRTDRLADGRVGWLDVVADVGARVGLSRRAALEGGFRVAHLQASRADRDEDDLDRAHAFSWAPRLGVHALLARDWTVGVSYSRGFRPTDARFVVDGQPLDVAVVDHVELRTQVDPRDEVTVEAAGFAAFGQTERLVDLLTGAPLLEGDTRRLGGELATVVRPVGGMVVGLDGAFADARLLPSGTVLPYASRWRASAWLGAEQRVLGPILLTGTLRFSWSDGRPLPGGFVARDVWTLDLLARIDWRRWTFDVRIENLAPWEWRYAEFVHPSRWDPEGRASPLPIRHVVAGRPFALRLGVSRWF